MGMMLVRRRQQMAEQAAATPETKVAEAPVRAETPKEPTAAPAKKPGRKKK